MKKGFVLGLILLLAFLAFSCGSSPAAATAAADSTMPPWINDMIPEGTLYGIGVSDNAQINMRMTMADARGRADIARQISTLVQGMVTDYAREAGGINDTAAMQFAETVNRQVSQATLQGAVADQRWTAPDGKTLWMRVKISQEDAAQAVNSEINKAVDSDAARYAEFKAMDALKMMESQLEKSPQSPVPVTTD